LRDRIIAIVVEDTGVEPFGTIDAGGRSDAARLTGIVSGGDLLGELIEEKAAKGLGRTRVACEERALDGFGQVRQREYMAIEAGEIRREPCTLVWREL